LSAAVSAALHRCHTALAFMDVGVGFADRAIVVVAVGFSQDLWVLHINICITSETMSTFDGGTNFILRIKEQETCLILHEHDDDDDDDDDHHHHDREVVKIWYQN
jgi:ABC-type Zn2+ transport system substrate-binding protein/surface adhesin